MSSDARTVSDYLRNTTLKSILGIGDDALDQIMATAYSLYQSGRYQEAEVLCRGLVSIDQTYWWSHSLHAATLRRLGRLDEALAAADTGLSYEPGQAKLTLLRSEIVAAIAVRDFSAATLPATSAAPVAVATAAR